MASTPPASAASHFANVPSEILLQVLENLNFKDLIRVAHVNKYLSVIIEDETLWKIQCERVFMLEKCPQDSSWKQLFMEYYRKFGSEHHVYRDIRTAWNKIMGYLAKYDKVITGSLRPGATEEELAEAETKLGCRFPADIRCSLKIYNGQKQGAGPGLLGCIAISTHFRSEKLLDCKTIAENFSDAEDAPLRACTPITYCCMTQRCQLMSFRDEYGIPKGQIFFPCADEESKDDLDAFTCGKTYLEWIDDLAELMDKEIFYRIRGCHFRFLYVPDCVATTRDMFSCRAGSCFMPDLSTVHPPSYFYVYRITITMDKSAPRSESCQLESRYWSITDSEGNEEIVEGPGVVGERPVFVPGEEYSWESGTTFPTTYGNMKGHFSMRNLITDQEFKIECPVFHMECLPFETSAMWKERAKQFKKNCESSSIVDGNSDEQTADNSESSPIDVDQSSSLVVDQNNDQQTVKNSEISPVVDQDGCEEAARDSENFLVDENSGETTTILESSPIVVDQESTHGVEEDTGEDKMTQPTLVKENI